MAQQVTINVNGSPVTVTETSPGLFGSLGYSYVSGGSSSPTSSPSSSSSSSGGTYSGGSSSSTPTTNNQAEIDRLKAEALKLQQQLDTAQAAGYQGNQQIQNFSDGTIKPNESTGNPAFDAVIKQMNQMFEQALKNGQKLNPQLDLSKPEVMKQFIDQAETELDPYYKTLFSAAKKDVYSYMDNAQKQYDLKVKQEAETFRRNLGAQREDAAGRGMSYSSNAGFQEQNMVNDTNRNLESYYNTQNYDLSGKMRDYTSKYGTDTGLTRSLSQYGVNNTPSGTSYERQLTNLTPESAITGSEEFKARAAKNVYAKELGKWKNDYMNVGN